MQLENCFSQTKTIFHSQRTIVFTNRNFESFSLPSKRFCPFLFLLFSTCNDAIFFLFKLFSAKLLAKGFFNPKARYMYKIFFLFFFN